MFKYVVVWTREESSGDALGLPIPLNNWAAEANLQELENLWLDWCASANHHTYVTANWLSNAVEHHSIPYRMLATPRLIEIVQFGRYCPVNHRLPEWVNLAESMLDCVIETVIKSRNWCKEGWLQDFHVWLDFERVSIVEAYCSSVH
jgi:hypothetical protein